MPPIVIFKYTSYVYFNILFFHIIPQAPKITDQSFSVFLWKIAHFHYHIYFFWIIKDNACCKDQSGFPRCVVL